MWCLPSDRGYLRRVRLVVSLGFQLETALGCAAEGLRAGGFGQPLPSFIKCGRFFFPSTLLPSPQLLSLAPRRDDGDSLPRSGEMSKSGEVWFPGPGRRLPSTNKPVANHPWPALRGLEHHANEAKVRLCPSQASIAARRTWSHSLSLQPSPVPLGLEVRPREGVGASVPPALSWSTNRCWARLGTFLWEG